jgi:hypothetical protein
MTMFNGDWRTWEGFRDEDNGAQDLYRVLKLVVRCREVHRRSQPDGPWHRYGTK